MLSLLADLDIRFSFYKVKTQILLNLVAFARTILQAAQYLLSLTDVVAALNGATLGASSPVPSWVCISHSPEIHREVPLVSAVPVSCQFPWSAFPVLASFISSTPHLLGLFSKLHMASAFVTAFFSFAAGFF